MNGLKKLNNFHLKYKSYSFAKSKNIKKLQQGAFGICYYAEDTDGQQYVIKKQKTDALILEEIKTLKNSNHKNVVSYYGSEINNEVTYLFMEYLENGDLWQYFQKMEKEKKRMPEKNIWNIFLQICEGVKYVHSEKIIHRDIKLQNVFYGKNRGIVKIGDFGLAKKLNIMNNTVCGTMNYAAPEILNGENYDQSVDIWALGVCLYTMLKRKIFIPYKYQHELDIDDDNTRNFQAFEKIKSEFFRKLLPQMLDINPKTRIKIDDLVNILKDYEILTVKELTEMSFETFKIDQPKEAITFISKSSKAQTNIKLQFNFDKVEENKFEMFARLISKFNTIVYLNISLSQCNCNIHYQLDQFLGLTTKYFLEFVYGLYQCQLLQAIELNFGK